jgi:ABC-type branched-subunit amino acid transport system ATPase component
MDKLVGSILAEAREHFWVRQYVEHDIGVVMGLSHHVVVLDYGKKVGDGTPEEVRRNPDVIAAYLGVKH